MGKKYLISVVTPFHNVDMDMFKNAYDSIKKQTIGFKNIQWIIVVHNSDKGCLEAVEELVGGHDNILVKELNNDAHTPSSPRNYGMKFTEGEYLAFLDGDDCFTTFALETIVNKAKTHGADVVVFRREYELENENLTTVTEVTLWNQTFEEIVMDRANWDTEKMFSGIWGMVTSRIFNVDYLNEHNIVFDEEIPFAEDMDFVISAYTYADTVVYLPQTIGYHYFINGGSLMQSMDKPGDVLVAYAKGFAKIFEKMMNMGVYADSSVNGLCMFLAGYIVNSQSITYEQKETIRDILEPYLEATGKSIVNKTCSVEESEITYSFPREIILNPDSKRSSYSMRNKRNGMDVLSRILHENAETDYGTRYQFTIIQTDTGYQARVPLADMESYRKISDLQMKIGETGIITSKTTPLFLSKVLATGEKRFSLATKEYLDKLGMLFIRQILGKKNALFISSRFPTKVYNAFVSDIHGVMLTYYNTVKYSLVNTGTEIVTPELLLFPQENTDMMYYQALFAIANADVEQVIASSFWKLCEILDCIKKNWRTMVDDLDKGVVTGSNIRSEKFEKALNALIVADSDRALYLKGVFKLGFNEDILLKIWPKLSNIYAPEYGTYKIYEDRLSKAVKGVTVTSNELIVPEGIIGASTGEKGVFELCRDEIFYEFIPFEYRKNTAKKPLFINDLVVGDSYIVVITNNSGLYRYNSRMVIEITKNDFDSVQFKYRGYLDEYFEDEDFLLDDSKIYEQIAALNKNSGANITDFAYAIEDNIFILYFETSDNEGISSSECTKLLKEQYKEPYFKDVVACKIDNGSQLLYRELVNYKYNISNDRLSPIRLITTKAQRMLFEGCILKEGGN